MALVGMDAASANRNQFLAMTRMSGYFLDRMQGLATLKLFGQAYHELANINQIADGYREKTMSVLRIAFLSSAILEFFSAVAVALVAVYVGLGLLGQIHFGPAQKISLSEALFVLLLAPEFFMPLRQLATFYHDKAAALGATDAILSILEQDTDVFNNIGCAEVADASIANNTFNTSIIEFRHASKYYGQRQVLSDINLHISVGEKIALVGESGAGKTTLLNLLLGFEAVTEGLVLLKGKSVTPEQALATLAWAGQQTYIFHGSIRDNITLANPEASEQCILAAATAAGVTEFSSKLAEGLLTQIGERGYGLSGGQIQRIALARAFLKDAEIIVLDEPTANLDAINKMLLLEIIDELFKDKTLIIASHDNEVIKRMDRKIVIQQGRLVS
jgi:ATP-binding cassette subfamily C protein CydD